VDLTFQRPFSNSVGEGDTFVIPIYVMNTDKDIWGEDAFEFKCVFNQALLLLETNANSSPQRQTRTLGITSKSHFGKSWRVGQPHDLYRWPPCVYRIPIRAPTVRPLSSSPPHSPDRSHYRMKSLLFALIRNFEFDLVFPAEDIVWEYQMVTRRPRIRGSEQDGPKLPLYVKIHIPDA